MVSGQIFALPDDQIVFAHPDDQIVFALPDDGNPGCPAPLLSPAAKHRFNFLSHTPRQLHISGFPTMHHWILLACHYFSGLTVRSPIGFELDMMLPPSQLEMPSHQEKGMTTSITLDPSNLASISLYLPSFIAGLSLATTLARIATLPLDCAIVTRPGENRRQNLPYLVCDVVPFPSKHLKGRATCAVCTPG